MKSVIQPDRETCFLTGSTTCLEEHHIMNAPYRQKSEKFGLKVMLTHRVHSWLHNTRQGRRYSYLLKAYAQKVFEQKYGHKIWMKEFHKDYSGYWEDEDIRDIYGLRFKL